MPKSLEEFGLNGHRHVGDLAHVERALRPLEQPRLVSMPTVGRCHADAEQPVFKLARRQLGAAHRQEGPTTGRRGVDRPRDDFTHPGADSAEEYAPVARGGRLDARANVLQPGMSLPESCHATLLTRATLHEKGEAPFPPMPVAGHDAVEHAIAPG